MNKYFFFLIVSVFCVSSCSQHNGGNEEKELRQRFSGFVNAISEKNLNNIRQYTYPRLFAVLSPDESAQVLTRSYALFNTKGVADSIRVDTLYPIKQIDNGKYAVAIYSLSLKIKMDTPVPADTLQAIDKYPAPQVTLMATLMRSFNVFVSGSKEENGTLWMHIRVFSIAAKDEFSKDWSFYTITEDQETPNKLFSKKIIEKLVEDIK